VVCATSCISPALRTTRLALRRPLQAIIYSVRTATVRPRIQLTVKLLRLSVILFTHFSTHWVTTFSQHSSARKVLAVLAAFSISALADIHFDVENVWRFLPGYGALIIHGLSSVAAEHTIGVLAPSLGSTFTISAATLGASLFALPFYILRSLMLNFPSGPTLPFLSLSVIPFAAYSLLFMTPMTLHSFDYMNLTTPVFAMSFPTLAILSGLLGGLAFLELPSWSDLVVAFLLFFGVYSSFLVRFLD